MKKVAVVLMAVAVCGCISVPDSMRAGKPMAIMAIDGQPFVAVSPLSKGWTDSAQEWMGSHPWMTLFTGVGAGVGAYEYGSRNGWWGGQGGHNTDSGNTATESRNGTVTISGNSGSTIIVNQMAPESMNEQK